MGKENKQNWYPYILIIVVGFLIYLPTLFFNFTYLDDNILILDNYHFLHKFSNIFQSFKQDTFFMTSGPNAYYRPLLTISFILDAQLGNFSFFRYHLTNIIIHLLVSCLLFLFLVKLKYRKDLSLFFSLIFTVHPVLTQAVAWIPGRNDSLLAVFALAAFIFFIKFVETKKWKYYFWHLSFLLLALFTKEAAVVIPALIVLYFYAVYKQKLAINYKHKIILGWSVIMVFWFLLRQAVLSKGSLGMTIFDMFRSMILGLPAAVQYIGKIIFPLNLSVLPLIQDTAFIYGILALILLIIGLLVSKNKHWGFIVFGLVWFFIFLLPSFIRPNPGQFADFMEHRIYLPMIGFVFVLAEIDLIKNLAKNRRKLLVIGIVIVTLFSVITLIHSNNFKNRINFWESANKTSPHSPLAHRNMGAMYYLDGFFDKGEAEYKKALELNSQEPMVHNNLGLIYMNTDRFEEAEQEFEKEIKINPNYDNVYYNFGLLRYRQGKSEEAERLWKKTLEINSDYIDANYALIIFYSERKEIEKANYYFEHLRKMGVEK